MSSPPVSVVMAVYNGAQFLSLAVQSVLAQEFRDFEFIVVDDGSSDGSGELLDRFCREDSRLRAIRGAHIGLAASLNLGCANARGGYIARMDADDIALPAWLSTLVTILEGDRSVALLGAGREIIDADGRFRGYMVPPVDDLRNILNYDCAIYHSTIVFRKAVFEQLGGYRPVFADAEDYDLYLRFADDLGIANVQQPLVKYRIHSTQVSSTRIEQNAYSALGAQVAAKLRREQGSDEPFVSLGTVSRESLRRFGVRDQEIDRQVMLHSLETANRMLRTGYLRASAEVLENCLRRELRIDGHDKARLHRTLSSVYRRSGKVLSSALPLGRAFYHDSSTMASVLLGRLKLLP